MKDSGSTSVAFDSHHAGHFPDNLEGPQRSDRGTEGSIVRVMGHDDQLGIGTTAVLPHSLDRHAVLGKDLGNGGKTCDHVSNFQGEVITGHNTSDLADRTCRVAGLTGADGTTQPV